MLHEPFDFKAQLVRFHLGDRAIGENRKFPGKDLARRKARGRAKTVEHHFMLTQRKKRDGRWTKIHYKLRMSLISLSQTFYPHFLQSLVKNHSLDPPSLLSFGGTLSV